MDITAHKNRNNNTDSHNPLLVKWIKCKDNGVKLCY